MVRECRNRRDHPFFSYEVTLKKRKASKRSSGMARRPEGASAKKFLPLVTWTKIPRDRSSSIVGAAPPSVSASFAAIPSSAIPARLPDIYTTYPELREFEPTIHSQVAPDPPKLKSPGEFDAKAVVLNPYLWRHPSNTQL
jgi:hypothetical protein